MPVKIVTDIAEFEQLREKWNTLVKTSVYPNIFTTWEWSFLWWKHFGTSVGRRDNSLFILLVENDAAGGELLAIFPLYRTGNGRFLYWIGYGARPCPEYLGPVIRRDAVEVVVQTACDFLVNDVERWDRFFFEEYAMDDPGTLAFADRLKQRLPNHVIPGEPRYFINFPDSFDAFLETLSRNNRKSKKKRLNKSKTEHQATTEVVTIGDLEHGFSIFGDLTTQSRQRKRQSSPFMQKSFRDFHREVLETLLPLNRAMLFLLKYSDQPVGIQYGYTLQQKFYAYQIGFASEAPGSPGDVTLLYLLKHLIDRHFTEFDFLRGDEEYKSAYTKTIRKTETLSVYKRKNVIYYRDRMVEQLYNPLKGCIIFLLKR